MAFRKILLVAATFVGALVIGIESPAAEGETPFTDYERSHWSFLPREKPPLPTFANANDRAWLRTPADAFILERLRRAELGPSFEAEKGVLIRRLFFDLLGLPPLPDDVQAFLDDSQPDAYERLVDRLLAHPQHGEHWAQHWLDVVRYGETEGFEYDQHRPGAWRYRDYVIESLNADIPYDQFVTEQLAGDESYQPTNAMLAAAGFHRLGAVRRNAGNTDVAFSRNEVLTEMTDAVGTVFMGITVSCARCHDHKFDAIRQKDYYRMQAFLAATQEHDLQLAGESEKKAWNDETERIKDEMKRIREAMQKANGLERDTLLAKLRAAENQLPPPLPTISTVRNKVEDRTTVHVLYRGDTEKKREQVGPRVLGILTDEKQPELPPDVDQPRTRLAKWLLAPDHPLTSRVQVNRLWHYHFGQGLVATPNDLGVNGAAPSHTSMLDFLANQLVDGQWYMKRMHRLMVTSSAYRQASDSKIADVAKGVDPDNRWLWRFNRKRLEAESLRDSMLAIAGRLNTEIGGASVLIPVEKELVGLLYKPAQWAVTPDVRQHDRRSIYLMAKRNLRVPFLQVFDQPDLQSSCAGRPASTHAPQALELLNGDFANELANDFAARLVQEAGVRPEAQIELAFRMVAGRSPTTPERTLSIEFLKSRAPREFALAMFSLNSFIYVD